MKYRSSNALTLIEFLLAITIFATVALSVYATFFNGIQISKKAKNFETFYRNIRFTLDTIQYDLENMLPYQFDTQDPPVTAFSGNANSFNLISGTDNSFKRIRYLLINPQEARIHSVQIGLHTSKNVSVQTGDLSNQPQVSYLIRQEEDWGKPPVDEVLNKQIIQQDWKISYCSIDQDNNLIWKNEWNEITFPSAVKIELSFLDPDDPKHKIHLVKTIYIPLGANIKTKT